MKCFRTNLHHIEQTKGTCFKYTKCHCKTEPLLLRKRSWCPARKNLKQAKKNDKRKRIKLIHFIQFQNNLFILIDIISEKQALEKKIEAKKKMGVPNNCHWKSAII